MVALFSVLTLISFSLCFLGFAGKKIISDDAYLKLVVESAYLKASKEERETIDKRVYRVRGAMVFLFIGIANICIMLRCVLDIAWLTYAGVAIYLLVIVCTFITDYTIKNKAAR